jgi:hypothetical protein
MVVFGSPGPVFLFVGESTHIAIAGFRVVNSSAHWFLALSLHLGEQYFLLLRGTEN